MKNKNLSKKNSQGLTKMVINWLLDQWAKHAVKEADKLYNRRRALQKEYLNGIINGKERAYSYERVISTSYEDYQILMWKAEHKTMEDPDYYTRMKLKEPWKAGSLEG